ncbi:unannotated protein [freshwater metagenome]|uniref:Unannotated protein n=1 Tax=freshwater metagenome TaxID=449393 RepID=A0A6J7G4K3_9ZZZZ
MMRASARHTHARHLMPMPEAHSIGTKFGFAKIVAAAGLRMPPNREPPLMSRADAICVFIEVYGFMPRKDDLTWMGRAHGIQLMSADKYLHSVEAKTALERFASRGRWCPPISTRGLVRPEQWEDIEDTSGILAGLAIKYPRKRAADQGHTLEEVRSAIALAWDALPKGQSLTVERYASVRRTQGLPHYGTAHKIAQRNGTTFAQLVRDEADARSRRDGRTKSD